MKQQQIFQVDLTKIDGVGDFPCPSCGETISPDDESGVTYEIVDVKMENDSIDKLIIVCNKCSSLIHISGFESLNQYEDL
jgi:phage terminase large subunit GpA-like protein